MDIVSTAIPMVWVSVALLGKTMTQNIPYLTSMTKPFVRYEHILYMLLCFANIVWQAMRPLVCGIHPLRVYRISWSRC